MVGGGVELPSPVSFQDQCEFAKRGRLRRPPIGIVFDTSSGMMTHETTQEFTPNPPVLRWVFRRGADSLVCRLDRQITGGFAITILPEWDAEAARVITFPTAGGALQQHAAITRALRDLGWVVSKYTADATRTPVAA
jgi:hypothetical protein